MPFTRSAWWCAGVFATVLALSVASTQAASAGAQMASAPQAAAVKATGLLAPAELERLLPPSVYFSGQSAPLQLRNSAGYRSASGHVVWAGLVDTSGYSTGVREKYQFYFVTEVPLTAGTLSIRPGVYGGGFLADNTFVLLNVGGDEVGRTRVREDKELRRPRPLQMTTDSNGLRLYLGRQFLVLATR